MTGADSGSGVAMEVLVKQDEVTPVRVGLEFFQVAEHWPSAATVSQEYARQTARQFARYLPQRHHLSGSSRELDFEVVAEVVVKFLQRLDEQVVRREPDRSSPIGIAAKQPCRRFARLIVNAALIDVHVQGIRIVAVELRQRTNAVG